VETLLSWPRRSAEYLSSVILSRFDLFRYRTIIRRIYYLPARLCTYNPTAKVVTVILSDRPQRGAVSATASSYGKTEVIKLPYVQRSLTSNEVSMQCSLDAAVGGYFWTKSLVLCYGWLSKQRPTHDAWVFCPKTEVHAHRRLNNDGL
jgi:hypothetical protein